MKNEAICVKCTNIIVDGSPRCPMCGGILVEVKPEFVIAPGGIFYMVKEQEYGSGR